MTAKLMTQQPAFKALDQEFEICRRVAERSKKGIVDFDSLHQYHMQAGQTLRIACEIIEELQTRVAYLETSLRAQRAAQA